MGKMLKGLFSGGAKETKKAAVEQQENALERSLNQDKQREILQNQEAENEEGMTRARRGKRGQRLLIASESATKQTIG